MYQRAAYLLNECHVDVNSQDKLDGSTVLHVIARTGSFVGMLEWLIKEKGADLSKRDFYSNTPLHTAIENRHYWLANELIGLGADINAKGRGGQTALHMILKEKVHWHFGKKKSVSNMKH